MEILSLLFLSTLVEGFVKYLFDVISGVVDGGVDNGKFAWFKKYTHFLALALGVGLAIAYRVDVPAMFGLSAIHPMVNYIVSGIVIGRGSNYLNDIMSSVNHAAAPMTTTTTPSSSNSKTVTTTTTGPSSRE